MKSEIFEAIHENRKRIESDSILISIYWRARKKFMKEAGERVVLYEIRDYIFSQLKWKKQDSYLNAPALISMVCDAVAENFDMLIENEPENYRDLFFQISNC